MSHPKLRVALLGCGQIADAHLQEIRKLRSADVVATCDSHRDLAMQAAARFDVPAYFDDLATMLREARPDVVHIATPAHTHFDLARLCLQAGKHVYVEKPFTQTASEAEALVAIARERGLQICVGHDQLFDPAWLALKERVARGEIGSVTHVESVLGYPISGQFGSQVAADPRHWVRRLPGGLFQNTISHPLYRITELLKEEEPDVFAVWARRAPFDFPTELNVVVRGATVTGTLTFSSAIPSQRITRVYGTKGGLEVDLDGQVVRSIGPSKAPGAFAKLLTPWKQWREAGRNLRRNLWQFAKADIHYFAGLKGLCEQFYASISEGGAVPIDADEIVRVTRLMDRIFADARSRDEASAPLSQRDRDVAPLPKELEVAR
jgi:predicted dehydrogenase